MIAGQSHTRDANNYIRDVLSGKITSCRMLRLAFERHLRDLETADDRGYVFKPQLAADILDFFPLLNHLDGEYATKPFDLYPWQKAVLYIVMGWRRKTDNGRRFRNVTLQLARGNGKTPLAAALGLLLFVADHPHEPNPKVYTTATKRDQAMLCFKTAKSYSEQQVFKNWIQPKQFQLVLPDGGEFTALSCDGKTADGLQVHGLIRDEYHAWRHTHEEFEEKLTTALGKRRQPLELTITTAGNQDSDLWLRLDDLNRSVLEGEIQADYIAPFIFETDPEDDILDEANWHKANPMLRHGVVKIQVLRDMAERAKTDASVRSAFQRYHCNRLVTSDEVVISKQQWLACERKLPDFTGAECFAGFDWGSVDDLTAVAYVFPLESDEGRRFAVIADCFIPSRGKHDIQREPWRTFIERGELTVTDGNVTNGIAVLNSIRERSKQFAIRQLVFDLSNCRDIALRVEEELGIDTYAMPQTPAKYNESFEEAQRAVKSERLEHNGSSILAWSATNVVPKKDANDNEMPSKRNSRVKIDPFVAIVMGVNGMLFYENTAGSIFDHGQEMVWVDNPWAS